MRFKLRDLTLLLAFPLAVASAQTVAPRDNATPAAAASAASAAPASVGPLARPGPRLMTPEQKRDAGGAALDLTPERQVTPQVSIPFGKQPAPSKADTRATRRGLPTSTTGGINDAAAACEAQSLAADRAACRERLGK